MRISLIYGRDYRNLQYADEGISHMVMRASTVMLLVFSIVLLAACQPSQEPQAASQGASQNAIRMLAVESFLADIAQQVAGDRLQVGTLMPVGLDPHAFEPTPQDVARIADADVLIVNGAGFEGMAGGGAGQRRWRAPGDRSRRRIEQPYTWNCRCCTRRSRS